MFDHDSSSAAGTSISKWTFLYSEYASHEKDLAEIYITLRLIGIDGVSIFSVIKQEGLDCILIRARQLLINGTITCGQQLDDEQS